MPAELHTEIIKKIADPFPRNLFAAVSIDLYPVAAATAAAVYLEVVVVSSMYTQMVQILSMQKQNHSLHDNDVAALCFFVNNRKKHSNH